MAQSKLVPLDTFSFINYDECKLHFDTKNSLVEYAKLRFDSAIQSPQKRFNIVHIGGSHVQAGTFPNTVRRNLFNAFPEAIGARGLLFPYSAAPKSNNPTDYRTRSLGTFVLVRNVKSEHAKPLGIASVAVYTYDTLAEIKIILKDNSVKYTTSKVILLGFSDSSNIVPTLQLDTFNYAPSRINYESRQFIYDNIIVTDSFGFRFNLNDSACFTITGILLENESGGISYHAIGANGASVASVLRCENFAEEISLLQPDVVIFGLGVNDASEANFSEETYKDNYLKLISQFQNVNPKCLFIFITNNDSYKKVGKKYQVNRNVNEVRKVMFELAGEVGGAVFDQFKLMGGLYSMEKWRVEKLAQNDRVHFTNKGYELMGKMLFNALINTFAPQEKRK